MAFALLFAGLATVTEIYRQKRALSARVWKWFTSVIMNPRWEE